MLELFGRRASARSEKRIVSGWFPLIALSCLLLPGCSATRSVLPTPELQANLAQRCPPLEQPPSPLVDPERSIWENKIISQYGDCGARHRATVDAWPK